MKARHDRRTWWLVGALVVVCGIAIAVASTRRQTRPPAGWEIIPVTGGGLRAEPFTVHMAVLRLVEGSFEVAEDSEIVVDVPGANALVVRRGGSEPVFERQREPIDVVGAPHLAVRIPLSRLELALRATGEGALPGRTMRCMLRVQGNRTGSTITFDLGVGPGRVFAPTIPMSRTVRGSRLVRSKTGPPVAFRNEVLVARLVEDAADAGGWTVDDWRTAIARDLDQRATEAAGLSLERREAFLLGHRSALSRTARLAAILQAAEALPGLQALQPGPGFTGGPYGFREFEDVLLTARRALGDEALTAQVDEERMDAAVRRANLDETGFALVAQATCDPRTADWAATQVLGTAALYGAVVDDLLVAHESGRLELSDDAAAALRATRASHSAETHAGDVVEAVGWAVLLAAFAALIVVASRRARRRWVTPPGPLFVLTGVMVLSSLDVPVALGAVAPAPLAMLTAAWLVRHLGADIPSGGARTAAWALAGAAGLWVAGRVADSTAIEALGRALEFVALLALLDSARRAEPDTLALRAPPRAPPRWTVPLPYAVLAVLAVVALLGVLGADDIGDLRERVRHADLVALALSVPVAVAAGVWLGTGAFSPGESPPVVRTALGTWLAMLHVGGVATALLGDSVSSRVSGQVETSGSVAAFVFAVLVCLRFDTALTDRAIYQARTLMIRAVREVEPDP